MGMTPFVPIPFPDTLTSLIQWLYLRIDASALPPLSNNLLSLSRRISTDPLFLKA